MNLDRDGGADCVADLQRLPFDSSIADWVVCTEVLEHVADPEVAVMEMRRVLKPRGVVIASVPFLYPVHADPSDFRRWAPDGLRRLFGEFSVVTITPMGHALGTIASLIELATKHWRTGGWPWRSAERVVFEACRFLQWRETCRREGAACVMTTGYFVVAEKGGPAGV